MLMVRTLFGLLLNVTLNFLLIPEAGIIGAATATLITQVFVSLLMDAMLPSTRPLFFIKMRALGLSQRP